MLAQKPYDYLIVGTGPGGATLAKELADGKARVLILEYGPRFTKTGLWACRAVLAEQGRKVRRSEGGVFVGRARVLGGASYTAMGNAVTPPPRLLREWGIDLSRELAEARSDLRVELMPERLMGEGTKRINEAARSLGWEMKPTPKCVNFSRCKACGLCMFGCPTGAKWTSVEFVDQAVQKGADLLLNTEVKRVVHQNGRAIGVMALSQGKTVELRADRIILCAGALETPIILQNSGIREAGTFLAGDVFQATYGYAHDVGMQREPILATYLESHIGERELFAAPYMYDPLMLGIYDAIGAAPSPKLGLGLQIRALVKARQIDAKRLIGMMTKIRDEMTGEVKNDGTISKSLTKRDAEKLDEAHEINRKLLIAAGADPKTIFRGPLESGHPCCTAGIGRVLDENQETKIKGLYVGDASAFPSPLGMPPILTIVALSKRLAKHLQA